MSNKYFKNMIDLILDSEEIGRNKVKQLYPKYDFVESASRYESWDLSGTTSNDFKEERNFFLEIKDRKVNSTAYSTVILELDKFKRLLDVANKNNNASIFYINFYTDGVALVYNLRELALTDVTFSKILAGKTTLGNNGTAVMKDVIELPYSKAYKRKLQ